MFSAASPDTEGTAEKVKCPRCRKMVWEWAMLDLTAVVDGPLAEPGEICGECFQHLTAVLEEVDEADVLRQAGAPEAVLTKVRERHAARAERKQQRAAEPVREAALDSAAVDLSAVLSRLDALEREVAALRRGKP